MYHATTPTAVVAPRASPHGSRASRRSKTTPRRTTTLFSARVDVALNHVRRDDGVTSTGTSLRARHSRGRSLTRVRAKKGFFREGISTSRIYIQPGRESVGAILVDIITGLQSALTYVGAKDLEEFHRSAVVGVQTPSGYGEGTPHGRVVR